MLLGCFLFLFLKLVFNWQLLRLRHRQELLSLSATHEWKHGMQATLKCCAQ